MEGPLPLPGKAAVTTTSLHVVRPTALFGNPHFPFIASVHHKRGNPWKKVSAAPSPPSRLSQKCSWEKGPTTELWPMLAVPLSAPLQGLALPQLAGASMTTRRSAGSGERRVAPQCTVDQRTLAFLIQVVHLGGEAGQEQGKVTAEHHFVTVTHMCCEQTPFHRRCMGLMSQCVSLWRVCV